MQKMIDYDVVQISKDGTKMRVNLQFWVHLGKYSKKHGSEDITLFSWFEMFKRFNRRTRAVPFDEMAGVKKMTEPSLCVKPY